MLDSYVNERLMRWADWVMRTKSHALGYPGQSCYTNLMPRTGFSSGGVDVSEAAMEVERAVIAVRIVNPQLHQVLIETYININKTSEQRYKSCGCGRATFYSRLGRAQQLVHGFLLDIAADYPLPTVDTRAALAA